MHRLITFVKMIRFTLAYWDLSFLLGPSPVQIGCTEHIMTGNILLEANVNPHGENVFGVLIETIGMLNLNISGRYYRRTQCTDEQERPRSECVDTHANLQFRV